MARILIIACGQKGQALAKTLISQGHTVRGTTRDPTHKKAIDATGAEATLADPDRVATLIPAFEGAAIAVLLLASATGTPPHLQALHTTRLQMLLTRTIDTTIRGIVYDQTGTLDPELLKQGARRVRTTCKRSRIPHRILQADPPHWLQEASEAVESLLETGR